MYIHDLSKITVSEVKLSPDVVGQICDPSMQVWRQKNLKFAGSLDYITTSPVLTKTIKK